MSWDIYGEPLRRGHCEVHPHVHEEYPCSVCLMQSQRRHAQQAEQDARWAEEHNRHMEMEFEEHLFDKGGYGGA